MSILRLASTIAIASILTLMTTSALAKERTKGRGAPMSPVVYVTSQDLFYDSIVVTTLPFNDTGNFQKLEIGPMGPQTEFGPGDVGYYGGRWWMDTDGNGYMDEYDTYFLCPLLGPGRDEA